LITIYYIIEKLIIVNRKAHGNVPLGTMFSFHAVESSCGKPPRSHYDPRTCLLFFWGYEGYVFSFIVMTGFAGAIFSPKTNTMLIHCGGI